MVHVLAVIEVHPGRRDDFLKEFRRIVPLVRAEAGCLEYVPTVDAQTGIGNQQPHRPDVVTVVERWESLDALKAHLVAPHMVDYRPRVKDLVATVKLYITEPAD